jgi:hypothetical protein
MRDSAGLAICDVVRVRVCAPMEVRERALMARSDCKNKGEARQEIERNDAAHRIALQC